LTKEFILEFVISLLPANIKEIKMAEVIKIIEISVKDKFFFIFGLLK
jgi:hypothetical protein